MAGDWALIEHIASFANILLVTQGAKGVVVFEKGQPRRHFTALQVVEVDPTGAGDILQLRFCSATPRIRILNMRPIFANKIAGASVQAKGLEAVPENPNF